MQYLPQVAMIALTASVVAADLPDATHVLMETLFRGGYVPRSSLKVPWWGVAPPAPRASASTERTKVRYVS